MARYYKAAFFVLTIFFLLFSLAIFIAGSLIYLNVQSYEQISQSNNPLLAILSVILGTAALSGLFIYLIRKIFLNFLIKSETKKTKDNNPKILEMLAFALFTVLFKELLTLFIKRTKKNYEK